MAFPDVAATNNNLTTGGTDSTTHNVNVPAGTASGQRLFACLSFDDLTTVTWPGGWNVLIGGSARVHVAYKDLSGAESNFTVTSGTTTMGGAITATVTGHDSATPAEAATKSTGSANPLTLNSLNPTGWGVEDTLWFAFMGWADANRTLNTFPSNCPDDRVHSPLTVSSCGRCAIATASSAGSSFDPTDGTLSTGHLWEAVTVGVRPAQPAPTGFQGAGIPMK